MAEMELKILLAVVIKTIIGQMIYRMAFVWARRGFN
jgi:hypothetical protein